MKLKKHLLVILLLFAITGISIIGDRSAQQTVSWLQPSIPITLYFGADDAGGVIPVVRWMALNEADIVGRLQALIDGPTDTGVHRSVPETTVLRSARIEGDVAVLDFDRAIVDDHPGGSAGEMLTVFSIVNTVTEIDGVKHVVFLVDGRHIDTLVGHLDLRYPIERDETFISLDQTRR